MIVKNLRGDREHLDKQLLPEQFFKKVLKIE